MNNLFFRPATRGELFTALKQNIKCEVVASNEEITSILLQSLNLMNRKAKEVKFKTYPSPNVGWVIYEPI